MEANVKTDSSRARMLRVRRALFDRGFANLAEAARAADLDYTTLTKVARFGMSSNPRVKTLEGLRKLGILEIVAGDDIHG